MRSFISSIEAEFRRYKGLADAAIAQLTDEQVNREGPNAGLSIAVIARHIAGNLRSRFADFLTSDGEKPWRDREAEFSRDVRARAEMEEHWETGWRTLFEALGALTDDQLDQKVQIRGTELSVHEALHRALAHASYHVGQVVYLAKAWRGPAWTYLSIPPGGSADFNRQPAGQQAEAHAARLDEMAKRRDASTSRSSPL
jgi:uncharacterized damage-inducible protein DinB